MQSTDSVAPEGARKEFTGAEADENSFQMVVRPQEWSGTGTDSVTPEGARKEFTGAKADENSFQMVVCRRSGAELE